MTPNDETEGPVMIVPHNPLDTECAAALTDAINRDPIVIEAFRNILIYGVPEPTDEQRARAVDFAPKSDG